MNKNLILFRTLLGLPDGPEIDWNRDLVNPDAQAAHFLEKGHVVEYIMYGKERKKIVSLFYGPGEWMVVSHPSFSAFHALDDIVVDKIGHSDMFKLLRQFPESRNLYREIRKKHEEKIRGRLKMINEMTPEQRFRVLEKDQAWVFELVKEDEIASYLGVSATIMKGWIGKN